MVGHAQEKQIQFIPENNIKVIDSEMETKLNLFPEYNNFKEARLYQKSDNSYVLEITYIENEDEIRIRKNLSQSELDDLRVKIQSLITTEMPALGLDQSGRANFLIGTTVLSLGYYGWAIPYIMNLDGSAAAGTYMLTAGLGFFIPYYATKESEVTKGMAQLSIGSGVIGLGHGAILYDLFVDPKTTTDEWGYTYTEPNYKALNLLMTVASLGELTAGYFYAKNNKVSEGRANSIVANAFWGAGYGVGASMMLYGDEFGEEEVSYDIPLLLGSIGGAIMGNSLANMQNLAPGDPTVMSNAGILGLMAGGTLLTYIEPNDIRTGTAIMLASTIGGHYLGWEAIKGYDFSNSTATYIGLGSLGGGVMGGGIALLTNSENEEVYSTLITGGAVIGFLITYNSLKSQAKIRTKTTSNLNWGIHPEGFFAGKTNKQYGTSIPFFTLNYKF
ncbi:MAG: hypothetical protein A2X64_04610 [Ignavibacteria bacterium GWF2_33_9]|nr:MAG: hypothetical protein A2X64_04610 [Ignavibacteria bacterium GWF2_33_9]